MKHATGVGMWGGVGQGGGGGENSGPNDSAGGHADWIYNVNWRKKLGIRHIRLGHGGATGGGGWRTGAWQGKGGYLVQWGVGGRARGEGSGGGGMAIFQSTPVRQTEGCASVNMCQSALKISCCWHVNPRLLPYHRKGHNWSCATLIVIRIPMRQSTRNQLRFTLGATH